ASLSAQSTGTWSLLPQGGGVAAGTEYCYYDPTRDRVVRFVSLSAYEFDGQSWSSAIPAGPDGFRVYWWDQNRFQGIQLRAPLFPAFSSTESVWTPLGWSALGPGGTAPQRYDDGSFAFDYQRNVLVWFIGSVGRSETWEWSAGAWQQRPQPGPSPRNFQ